jgi:hypothetical protein
MKSARRAGTQKENVAPPPVRPAKPAAAPSKLIATEYQEQCAVFEWAQWCKLPGIDLLYATLNGVRLPIGLAVKMSKAGLKRGPLDINLDVARGGWFGLRLELKRVKGGVESNEQKAWARRLHEENYFANVCHGAKEAIWDIEWYLGQPRTVAIPFITEED